MIRRTGRLLASETEERLNTLDRQDDLMKPAPRDILETWVSFLSAGAGINDPNFEAWQAEAIIACSGLPAGALSRDTLKEALCTFCWLPSMSALRAFLGPYAERIRYAHDAVQGVSRGEAEYRSWFTPRGSSEE